MPPVLDPSRSHRDGLAFLGLSLSRNSRHGNPKSVTHQTSFDLNEVQDRDYQFIFSTNDDGWLAGGGEPGPPKSYKLAAKDSSHVEIMRIGTYNPEWGGLRQQDIVNAIESGKILIPQIEVVPTAVVANNDSPPELEIRFDMDPPVPDFEDETVPLPVNWQLRFIHNQLFNYFKFPSRFCPGAFHSTIVRKAEFRSNVHELNYFKHCEEVISKWRADGPKPLNNGGWDINGRPLENKNEKGYNSGIYLFTDRENITHYFRPNFLPPYTGEKRKVILNFLKNRWDEDSLLWMPVGNNVDNAMEVLRKRQLDEEE